MRAALAVIAPAFLASVALAGPLTPPAGAIAATMKTTAEVEPRTIINAINTPGDADSLFKITQPGSYYLTGNLTGVAGKSGIEIASANVTIDLGGFTMTGVAGSLDGIRCVIAAGDNIAVRNGSITGFGGDGVDLTSGSLLTKGAIIENVSSSGNGGRGFWIGTGATLFRCTASSNSGAGMTVHDGGSIQSCTSRLNGGVGFYASSASTITGCTAVSNGGDGISCSTGCVISQCAANLNTDDGIDASAGCAITGCSLQYNGVDGIHVGSFTLVTDNMCESNGFIGLGAGIHAAGSRNRIEGNSCVNADVGIDTDNGGTVVVRNTCAGNTTNWSLAIGTVYGPIVDRTSIVSPAVSGNTAASALATTDPNANFTH